MNPHTRDAWGRRKRVDAGKALQQWRQLKELFQGHGIRVLVIPPVPEQTGTVFPANAGFRHGDIFYLSNLNPARAGEREHYRRAVVEAGLAVKDLPSDYPFEGEADFIPVGDPSGDPAKTVYLFTHGPVAAPRWVPAFGLPPYRRRYGFRSDKRVLPALEAIVRPQPVLPLELADESHYHGDTVLCPFGHKQEYLLAYLEALKPASRAALLGQLGDRVVRLERADARAFAANSFQITARHYGRDVLLLVMPDGLSEAAYREVQRRGVVPVPVDVSEFLEKGGGAVKCMLLNLGDVS